MLPLASVEGLEKREKGLHDRDRGRRGLEVCEDPLMEGLVIQEEVSDDVLLEQLDLSVSEVNE